jgi:hypothetical protein
MGFSAPKFIKNYDLSLWSSWSFHLSVQVFKNSGRIIFFIILLPQLSITRIFYELH